MRAAMWGPWIGSEVAADSTPITLPVDQALTEWAGQDAWEGSVAESIAGAANRAGYEWPTEDRRFCAWLAREGRRVDVDLRVSGVVLIRASDGAACIVVAPGSVAEPWGGGVTVIPQPSPVRYERAFMLPATYYPSRRF